MQDSSYKNKLQELIKNSQALEHAVKEIRGNEIFFKAVLSRQKQWSELAKNSLLNFEVSPAFYEAKNDFLNFARSIQENFNLTDETKTWLDLGNKLQNTLSTILPDQVIFNEYRKAFTELQNLIGPILKNNHEGSEISFPQEKKNIFAVKLRKEGSIRFNNSKLNSRKLNFLKIMKEITISENKAVPVYIDKNEIEDLKNALSETRKAIEKNSKKASFFWEISLALFIGILGGIPSGIIANTIFEANKEEIFKEIKKLRDSTIKIFGPFLQQKEFRIVKHEIIVTTISVSSSQEVFTLKKNQRIQLISKQGKWCYIYDEIQKRYGYVLSKYLVKEKTKKITNPTF